MFEKYSIIEWNTLLSFKLDQKKPGKQYGKRERVEKNYFSAGIQMFSWEIDSLKEGSQKLKMLMTKHMTVFTLKQ